MLFREVLFIDTNVDFRNNKSTEKNFKLKDLFIFFYVQQFILIRD